MDIKKIELIFVCLLNFILPRSFAEQHHNIPYQGTYYCLDHVSINDPHYEDRCLMEMTKPILVYDEDEGYGELPIREGKLTMLGQVLPFRENYTMVSYVYPYKLDGGDPQHQYNDHYGDAESTHLVFYKKREGYWILMGSYYSAHGDPLQSTESCQDGDENPEGICELYFDENPEKISYPLLVYVSEDKHASYPSCEKCECVKWEWNGIELSNEDCNGFVVGEELGRKKCDLSGGSAGIILYPDEYNVVNVGSGDPNNDRELYEAAESFFGRISNGPWEICNGPEGNETLESVWNI